MQRQLQKRINDCENMLDSKALALGTESWLQSRKAHGKKKVVEIFLDVCRILNLGMIACTTVVSGSGMVSCTTTSLYVSAQRVLTELHVQIKHHTDLPLMNIMIVIANAFELSIDDYETFEEFTCGNRTTDTFQRRKDELLQKLVSRFWESYVAYDEYNAVCLGISL